MKHYNKKEIIMLVESVHAKPVLQHLKDLQRNLIVEKLRDLDALAQKHTKEHQKLRVRPRPSFNIN